MSDSPLSDSQKQLGEQILNALTSIVKMPVTSHEWRPVPQASTKSGTQAGGYELVIRTPWVNEKGLEKLNWALLDALDTAHISGSTSFVRFESPDSKTAQAGA